MSDNEVQIAVLLQRVQTLEKRIEKIETKGNWVVMAVIGGVIATVLRTVGIDP